MSDVTKQVPALALPDPFSRIAAEAQELKSQGVSLQQEIQAAYTQLQQQSRPRLCTLERELTEVKRALQGVTEDRQQLVQTQAALEHRLPHYKQMYQELYETSEQTVAELKEQIEEKSTQIEEQQSVARIVEEARCCLQQTRLLALQGAPQTPLMREVAEALEDIEAELSCPASVLDRVTLLQSVTFNPRRASSPLSPFTVAESTAVSATSRLDMYLANYEFI